MKIINTDEKYISGIIRKRDPEAHKGNFGKVLIFAGSPGMAGAAVLNGRAALKGGAGLVQFLLPDPDSPLLNIFQTCVPEATCVFLSSLHGLSGYSAVSAGSGLGKSPENLKILTRIIESYTGVLVLDADALNLISENDHLADLVRSSESKIIITPHAGEARRLLGPDFIINKDTRAEAAALLAAKYNVLAVLKGAGTLVCDGDKIYKNTTGNPGMATAGSGDALAGLTASLAGQGLSPLDAARTAVFIHGKAGDLAAAELGEMGLISSDIVNCIPCALKLYY